MVNIEKIEDTTKKTDVSEIKADKEIFDLNNESSREDLKTILESNNNYLKMEVGVTYRIRILSSKVEKKTTTYEDGSQSPRYVFEVESKSSKGDKYEGVWEVGVGIMREIFKTYSDDAVYTATKTGSGLDTRYNIVKDF